MNNLNSLFDPQKGSYFTSIAGITNAFYSQYTKGSECIYRQILKIFNHYSLKYFLFAGSIVGYVRNKEMPPWMDDLDIIIFEDQIELFENKIVPHLIKAGFNAFVPERFKGGGYHVLALQSGAIREITIPFSADIQVQVPWAQVDVFYSKVDQNGFVRNTKDWGLYHLKDIPVNWVQPPRCIGISGFSVPAFNELEKDVFKEYGDVCNNLVVATHDVTFLKIDNISWGVVDSEFKEILANRVDYYTPSVKQKEIAAYAPVPHVFYTTISMDNFESILKNIIEINASAVVISHPRQYFWVMDLKRVLPNLLVHVSVSGPENISVINQLREYCDLIYSENRFISDIIESQISFLDLKSYI